jgi:hypothetical protein
LFFWQSEELLLLLQQFGCIAEKAIETHNRRSKTGGKKVLNLGKK